MAEQVRVTVCHHVGYGGDGHCGSMGCSNYVFKCPKHGIFTDPTDGNCNIPESAQPESEELELPSRVIGMSPEVNFYRAMREARRQVIISSNMDGKPLVEVFDIDFGELIEEGNLIMDDEDAGYFIVRVNGQDIEYQADGAKYKVTRA